MKRISLSDSGVEFSAWCLGTMTYSNQTPEADAHAQIDTALEAGVTSMDCAEMYPVAPVKAETVGNSERVLGNWLSKPGNREKVEVATKVSGANGGFVRDGAGFDGPTITQCIEDSLERLQTDYIDLYQLHWPNRGSYHFRQYWDHTPPTDKADTLAHMEEVLDALEAARSAGKIRAFGLSNETAWGTARWLDLAERKGAPKVAGMQNEYSLLCRIYDTDMAELSAMENIPLLAYSPLGAGLLTGKYAGGDVPEGSRASIGGDLGGRMTERAHKAVAAYLGLAREAGLDPVHMALAFVSQLPFPSIPIFGATTGEQLARILKGRDTVLEEDLIDKINDLHKEHPLPF